jgi:hypothetical protein
MPRKTASEEHGRSLRVISKKKKNKNKTDESTRHRPRWRADEGPERRYQSQMLMFQLPPALSEPTCSKRGPDSPEGLGIESARSD